MKALRFLTAVFMSIFVGGAFGVYARDKDNIEDINNKLVRFHIIANSDTDEDQQLKMELREYMFRNIKFDKNAEKNDVIKYFSENKEELQENINTFLKTKNSSYTAEVNVEKEYFSVRKYNNFVLPAGNYDAVVVKIGEAKGQNFFCVMYPSLCYIDSISGDIKGNMEELKKVLTDEQINLIEKNKGETVVKFKIVEILNKIF